MNRMWLHVVDGTEADQSELEATPDTIRAVLYPDELWYGTEVELCPAEADAPRLSAVSVSNAYIGPEEAGELVLGLEEQGVCYAAESEGPLTRDEVRVYFERFAEGDSEWLSQFVWVEVEGGRTTGRKRGST